MIATILAGLLPILFVASLGWLSGRVGWFDAGKSETLAVFVLRFPLPLALFLAAARTKPSDLRNPAYAASLAAGLLGTFALGIVLGLVAFRRDLRTSVMQGLCCGFPNMAYCGPPVLTAAVGAKGMLAVVVGNLIAPLTMVPLAIAVLELGARGGGADRGRLSRFGLCLLGAAGKPLVWMPALGAGFALLGVHLPGLVGRAIDELGRAAGGVALFTLGLMLSTIPLRLDRDVLANLALKNLLQPALMLGAAWGLGLEGTLAKEVFLIGLMPSATENAILAGRYGTYEREAAATTAASTVFSLVTIAAGLAIASRL